MKCKVCGDTGKHVTYQSREMMYGTRESFDYFQCSNCECLQIKEVPKDMGKYYPAEYYSYNFNPPEEANRTLKSKLRCFRNQGRITGKPLAAKLLNQFYPFDRSWDAQVIPSTILSFLIKYKIALDATILDIGCGSGELLFQMGKLGYKNLTGLDPFSKDNLVSGNVKILKENLFDHSESYDLIMFHHSFEHVDDPHGIMIKLKRMLKREALVLIRIPTVSSYAWDHYRENWMQLDAPRHFYLHSHRSLRTLVEKYHFNILELICDSDSKQFWGSEMYLRNIPLYKNISERNNPEDVFSKELMDDFRNQSEVLNQQGKGDQIQVVIKSH